jgi:hypothetical protein
LVPTNRLGHYDMLPQYCQIVTNKHIIFVYKETNAIIKTYFKTLCKKFGGHFLTSEDICEENLWIRNPFANQSDIKLRALEEDRLIELTTNSIRNKYS